MLRLYTQCRRSSRTSPKARSILYSNCKWVLKSPPHILQGVPLFAVWSRFLWLLGPISHSGGTRKLLWEYLSVCPGNCSNKVLQLQILQTETIWQVIYYTDFFFLVIWFLKLWDFVCPSCSIQANTCLLQKHSYILLIFSLLNQSHKLQVALLGFYLTVQTLSLQSPYAHFGPQYAIVHSADGNV